MKRRHQRIGILFISIVLAVFACVTVNIYFPAEKVESVAGEIVDEIRGREQDEKKSSPESSIYQIFQKIRLAASPAKAWAQNVTEVSNPTIRALKERMKARYNQLKPYYQKKLLSEGNDGFVSISGTQGLGLKEKRDLNNLVVAENNDRRQLYAEVARALNIDSSQVSRVGEIFAKEWQKY